MPTWDDLFKHEEHRWQEPHHTVISFAEALRRRGARQVLDLGCGAGRHVVYLARHGYSVCATDISTTGITVARQRLRAEHLPATLHLSDMTALPLSSGSVDAVISLSVIYHNRLGAVQRTVAEIGRVLRPAGLALLTLISTRGYRYGEGHQIEPDTYLPTTGPDTGLPHHFFDEARARSLLHGFEVTELTLDEHEEVAEDGSALRHSHWVCIVEKPGLQGPQQ